MTEILAVPFCHLQENPKVKHQWLYQLTHPHSEFGSAAIKHETFWPFLSWARCGTVTFSIVLLSVIIALRLAEPHKNPLCCKSLFATEWVIVKGTRLWKSKFMHVPEKFVKEHFTSSSCKFIRVILSIFLYTNTEKNEIPGEYSHLYKEGSKMTKFMHHDFYRPKIGNSRVWVSQQSVKAQWSLTLLHGITFIIFNQNMSSGFFLSLKSNHKDVLC